MQSLLIKIIIALVIIAIAIGIFGYFEWLHAPAPFVESNSASTTPTTSGGSSQSATDATYDPDGTSKTAVASAYQNASKAFMVETVSYDGTFINSGYAIQLWHTNTMSGQALLKYRPTKSSWSLVTANGGLWTLESLIDEGVPTTTAKTLYGEIPH